MLPSVSAGSAALMKYAQAITTAAPETHSGDNGDAAQTEQEAARHKADNSPAPNPAQEKLAQSARETVTALLELLRTRVASSLIDLGLPEVLAQKAADSAAGQLATTIAGDGRHAAEIVHALLGRLQAGAAEPADTLLNIVARGITVVIDHQTGDVRITPPKLDLTPGAPAATTAPTQHLLNVTDFSAEKAAPVLQALNAVQATASAYAKDSTATPVPQNVGGKRSTSLLVTPTAFVETLTAPLTTALQTAGVSPPAVTDTVKNVSAALSRTVATTINTTSSAAGDGISVTEITAAISQLQPVTAAPAVASQTTNGPVVLTAGNVAVGIDTANGAITVQIGNRVTTYAIASAAPPVSAIAPLPEIEAASLPVLHVPSGLNVAKGQDRPASTPFVPPEIVDLPSAGTAHPPAQKNPLPTQAQTATHIALTLEENLQHLDAAALRNATVIQSMESPAAPDLPGLTRVALDLTAEIGPGLQGAAIAPPVGKLGLPQAAPQQTAAGPVMKNGYADAAANLVPVLPPTYRRGDLVTKSKKNSAKKKQQQLPSGQYQNILIEDAMSRDMPSGHQGLVFSSVVFSV